MDAFFVLPFLSLETTNLALTNIIIINNNKITRKRRDNGSTANTTTVELL